MRGRPPWVTVSAGSVCRFSSVPARPGQPPRAFSLPQSCPLAADRLKRGDSGAVVAFDRVRRQDDPIADRALQVAPQVLRGARVAQLEDQPLLAISREGVEATPPHLREDAEVFVPVFRSVDRGLFHCLFLLPGGIPQRLQPIVTEAGTQEENSGRDKSREDFTMSKEFKKTQGNLNQKVKQF